MPSRLHPFRSSLLGWLIAIMAVFGQIASVAAAPEPEAAGYLGVLCSTDAPAPGVPAHHHHRSDCAICPHCAAVAVHAAVLSPGITLPAPSPQLPSQAALPPPARAPPSAPYRPGRPRGPPAFA